MNTTASISTDILAIITLCLTILLACRNPVVNHEKNRIYITVSALAIILLILEIATILLALSTSSRLVIPHRIANILGFSLSPLVPFIFLFFHSNSEKKAFYKSFLAIPLYLNALICIASYKTGWIFFVDGNNHYFRGELFLLPMITSAFYFLMLMLAVIKSKDEYKTEYRKFLILIFLMPMIGAILQIIWKDTLFIWGSVAVSLLLYYIFLREVQFKYDAQTGIKNRWAFEKAMEQFMKHGENVAIAVLDINNLKKINDKYGHKAGDEVICHTAELITESFQNNGSIFRIGGDEFCVICPEATSESMENALKLLEDFLKTVNRDRMIKIQIAYGYAFYEQGRDDNIFMAFTQADKAMYQHKAVLKAIQSQ